VTPDGAAVRTAQGDAPDGVAAGGRAPGTGRERPAPAAGDATGRGPSAPPGQTGAERVVLAIGSGYFHDGRVGAGRYASDLASSFVGAVNAGHLLLRGLFEELGAPAAAPVEASCDRWRLRFGNEVGQAQFVEEVGAEEPEAAGDEPASPQRGADEWMRGLIATRDADHGQALAAFEAEAAEASEAGAPHRAAIAYRSAAAAAKTAGRADHANRLLRLAGKAYLEISERPDTIPQGVFMAYREGARCFLEAGNLPLAHTCLTKAIAIGETLGYTAKQ